MNRLLSAWLIGSKRSLSQWKLLTSLVLGVILACTIISSSVIYLDSLEEIALDLALVSTTDQEQDLIIQAKAGVSDSQYNILNTTASEQIVSFVGNLEENRFTAIKSPTLFVAKPGLENEADQTNDRSYFVSLPKLNENITIVSGVNQIPEYYPYFDQNSLYLGALVPNEAANLFGLTIGDQIIAIPTWSDRYESIVVEITGIFERKPIGKNIWYMEETILEASTGPTFNTIPFYIPQQTFLNGLGPAFEKLEGTYIWYSDINPNAISAAKTTEIRQNLQALKQTLTPVLPSYSQKTKLEKLLEEYDRRLFYSKLPMFVLMMLITFICLYYISALSSMSISQRYAEIALIRSRGATQGQTLAVFALEALTIGVAGIILGPLLGAGAVSLLGLIEPLSSLQPETGLLNANINFGTYRMSAIGGGLSILSLLIPAIFASRRELKQNLELENRPSRLSAIQKYYLDIFALVLVLVMLRQIREQGSILSSSFADSTAFNQLLLLIPGIMLISAGLIVVRLFPIVINLVTKILAPKLSAGAILGLWQLGRNSAHHSQLTILLTLATGLALFAASFAATLNKNFDERVYFKVGADVRVNDPRLFDKCLQEGYFNCYPDQFQIEAADIKQAYESIENIDKASLVLRTLVRDKLSPMKNQYLLLAADTQTFPDVAWFRNDFAQTPMQELISSIDEPYEEDGLKIPLGVQSLSLTFKSDYVHPSVRLTLRFKDDLGKFSTYSMGDLQTNTWQTTTLKMRRYSDVPPPPPRSRWWSLRRRPNPEIIIVAPDSDTNRLYLDSVRIHERSPDRNLMGGSIIFKEISATLENGDTLAIESFDKAGDWNILSSSSQSIADSVTNADLGNGESSVVFAWNEGYPEIARGIFYGGQLSPVPTIANETMLRRSGHKIGDVITVSISGQETPLKIVGQFDMFPTITNNNQQVLVSNLDLITQHVNASALYAPLAPNEVWLSYKNKPDDPVTFARALAESSLSPKPFILETEAKLREANLDPLVDAGWQSLLFYSLVVVLILATIGFTFHSYISFRNRIQQFALLKTIGLSRLQLVTSFILEQSFIILLSFTLGAWLGRQIGAVMMPYLAYDEWGIEVMPPFIIETNWYDLLINYSIICIIFLIVSYLVVLMTTRTSVTSIMRLGDK